MFSFIPNATNTLLDIYKLLVLVYFILTMVKVPANKWITLLASVVEPALKPFRKLVNQYMPKNWQIIDWSPVALLIGISIGQWLLNLVFAILF